MNRFSHFNKILVLTIFLKVPLCHVPPPNELSPGRVTAKDYKGVYRLARKIKDEGFEADLYKKH